MDVAAASHIDAAARPAMVSEQALSADTLRRRGSVLTGEALADWPWLGPTGRGLLVSGLPGSLLLLDGMRLAPAATGLVDLAMIPLAVIGGARLSAGGAGAAQGAGSLSGFVDMQLAAIGGGSQILAATGGQAGRSIAAIDLRLGSERGWLGGGFTQGGGVPSPAGLAASGQQRWHLAGRFEQDVGAVRLRGRGLFASRRESGTRSDWHDVAIGLSGGTRWQWQLAAARGGQDDATQSSRLGQARAVIGGATGLILPGAAEPISVAAGAEWRQLRLAESKVPARELFAEAAVPLLQDRPAAENLVATLGVRQAWLGGLAGHGGRAETLWQAGGRWEPFPGIALRGQVARGIDDFGDVSGISRSVGLIATPAFVPGFAITVDRRWQSQGLARVQALDLSASWRLRTGDGAQLALAVLATHHDLSEHTLVPVPRFASLLRATLETGQWAVSAGWRHRTAQAGGVDVSLERQLSGRIRIVASVSNAVNSGRDGGPVGRQALLQLVAGF
ncbi:hypothetical protein [Sandarakinorhabdus sp.]|uniref:hypothetical protein n=1 Tax=Sandarakinorhabdus sp. TaxID=1916663 RepID=UPI003341EFFE